MVSSHRVFLQTRSFRYFSAHLEWFEQQQQHSTNEMKQSVCNNTGRYWCFSTVVVVVVVYSMRYTTIKINWNVFDCVYVCLCLCWCSGWLSSIRDANKWETFGFVLLTKCQNKLAFATSVFVCNFWVYGCCFQPCSTSIYALWSNTSIVGSYVQWTYRVYERWVYARSFLSSHSYNPIDSLNIEIIERIHFYSYECFPYTFVLFVCSICLASIILMR